MTLAARPITDSLTDSETAALLALVEGRDIAKADAGLLFARGFAMRSKSKATPPVIVTPEGLAALLDTVPVDEIHIAGCTHSPE